jgi:endonuclease III
MSAPSFDIDHVIEQVRAAIATFPKAAMFELADAGFDSLFEQLVACILSIRTYDEVSVVVARRLFALARTPAQVAQLPLEELAACLAASTFGDRKAEQILAIAQQIETDYGGELPADPTVLKRFNGVGPKCAHLALGVACQLPYISVDVHVHRVTNRWGYVRSRTPEQTLLALEAKLPKPYWVEINSLLVPFGKHICRGSQPRCHSCPVAPSCAQVGVS